jgi:hypothetical protein
VTSWDSKIYSVEVSGWDCEKHFFIERTSLYMDRAGTRTVILRNHLRNGLLVFVRLKSAAFAVQKFPQVYRVDAAALPDHTGFSKIHLTSMEPSTGPRQEDEYHATSGASAHLNDSDAS